MLKKLTEILKQLDIARDSLKWIEPLTKEEVIEDIRPTVAQFEDNGDLCFTYGNDEGCKIRINEANVKGFMEFLNKCKCES